MKKWNLINKLQIKNSTFKTERLLDILLKNRGLKTNKEKAIKRIKARNSKSDLRIAQIVKWQRDWKTAEKKFKSHVILNGNKPALRKLYKKLGRVLSPN